MEGCKSTFVMGDDFGDNDCTFHCTQRAGHTGKHIEEGNVSGGEYEIRWTDQFAEDGIV